MQITQYKTKKRNPAISTVVKFDQWPFKDLAVALDPKVGYINSSGALSSGVAFGWSLDKGDNCLVMFEDGTMAVSNEDHIALYQKNNGI